VVVCVDEEYEEYDVYLVYIYMIYIGMGIERPLCDPP
jgi:hypothetical protein